MKVFISWSGDASKAIATELNDWLPMVIQNVQTFMSAESIEKGTRWASVISKELEDTSVGIIVLTADNIKAPWINFEAGALAKSVEDTRLHSILFGIKPSDVGTPLSQFQITQFEKQDVLKLLLSINDSCGDDKLPSDRLTRIHDKFWTSFESSVETIMTSNSAKKPVDNKKPDADIASAVQEILVLARQQMQISHAPERILNKEVIDEIVRSHAAYADEPRRRFSSSQVFRELFRAWVNLTTLFDKLDITDDAQREAISQARSRFDQAFSNVMDGIERPIDRASRAESDEQLAMRKKNSRIAF